MPSTDRLMFHSTGRCQVFMNKIINMTLTYNTLESCDLDDGIHTRGSSSFLYNLTNLMSHLGSTIGRQVWPPDILPTLNHRVPIWPRSLPVRSFSNEEEAWCAHPLITIDHNYLQTAQVSKLGHWLMAFYSRSHEGFPFRRDSTNMTLEQIRETDSIA